MRVDYWIKPTAKGFALYERRNGKAKIIARAPDRQELEQFKKTLLPNEGQPKYSDHNLDIFTEYWEGEYLRRDNTPDSARSAKDAFNRMLLAINDLQIRLSPIAKLQVAINKLPDQRRAAMCLNVLLKWVARKERVYLKKEPERPVIAHITLSDLLRLKFDSEPERLLALSAFGTGMRFGELFAFEMRGAGKAYCAQQRDQNYNLCPTKTRTSRSMPIISETRPAVREWLVVEEGIKKELRRKESMSKVMQRLAKITFHDLRHSYAIHLVKSGIPIGKIARFLGDSIAVAEKYYAGSGASDEEAEEVAGLV